MNEVENVIIIGGGPAALAAAIYAGRAGLKPLVIAGSPPGGQLTLTSEVENYPGFESILGPDLILKMRKHAEKFGGHILDENVLKVDFSKPPFKINLIDKTYESKGIIISTGAKALWLNLPSETRLRGKGVSACATCDGFFFRDKVVAVIGGGDTAMEEALTLTKFANRVYIIHRRGGFRASKIMQDRVLKHPKIHIIYNAEVTEVLGEKKVSGVTVKIKPSDKSLLKKSKEAVEKIAPKMLQMKVLDVSTEYITGKFPVDGLFLAIGHKPDTDLFREKIELDRKGYIVTSASKSLDIAKLLNDQSAPVQQSNGLTVKRFDLNYQSMTSVPGIFAAGDCVDHVYKQAATAVGMGVAAALEVEKYLENNY